jgi:hypothetical protein
VVAVNAVADHPPRQTEVVEALFGDEQMESVFTKDGRITHRFVRAPNGVFGTTGSGRNKRLSAVLIAAPVTVWNLATTSIHVYHNPSTAKPLAGELSSFPSATFDGDEPVWTDGRSLMYLSFPWVGRIRNRYVKGARR